MCRREEDVRGEEREGNESVNLFLDVKTLRRRTGKPGRVGYGVQGRKQIYVKE